MDSMIRIPQSTASCLSIIKTRVLAPCVDKSNKLTADKNNHETSRETNLSVQHIAFPKTFNFLNSTCKTYDCFLAWQPHLLVPLDLNYQPHLSEAELLGP